MDIASDAGSQAELKLKKMQEAAKKHANVVVADVMNQISLKKRVPLTEQQIAEKKEQERVAQQINYNNIRQTIFDKISQHKMKMQQAAMAIAAKSAQKIEARQMRHEKFLADEKKRFEVRKARNNALISESLKTRF